MLGLFSLNSLGATGSVMYMINHGLSTGALFLCIGMIYERYHTKDMDQLGGLFKRMPVWSFFMVFFTLASLGLPGLNGFIGEFLCLMGCFTAEPKSVAGYPGLLGPWYAVVAGLGLVLAAMYLLIMLGKLVWGPLKEPHGDHGHGHGHGHGHAHSELPADLSAREIGILVPLAVVCLAIGFYPKPMLEAIAPSVEKTLAPYPALVAVHAKEGSLLPRPESASPANNRGADSTISPLSLGNP
jgi:NADH-quinone oxidoreductase subunit M